MVDLGGEVVSYQRGIPVGRYLGVGGSDGESDREGVLWGQLRRADLVQRHLRKDQFVCSRPFLDFPQSFFWH